MPEAVSNVAPVTELVPFALRLPRRVHRDIKILAALNGVSANTLVINVIQAHIEQNEKALGRAREAKKLIKE